ncbi:MAG: hypothetical protein MK100_08910, partial [Phycisphaerales bacterium]|nr:hypothetical protein [Phycisphaerales bacterium]
WTGGGVFADFGYIRFETCEIRGNTCLYGGGGLNFSYASADVINCIIDGNSTIEGSGAGSSCHRSRVVYDTCTFTNNMSSNSGAALNFETVPSSGAQPTMRDCTIRDNAAGTGAAIAISPGYYPQFTNNEICGNTNSQVDGDFDDLGGNCITEVCDSDSDGTFDCDDDCPEWPGDCSGDGQTIYVVVGESIQAAIDGVPSGGTIEVAAGTFQPPMTLDSGSKAFTLRGAVDIDGNPTTILDGQDSIRLLQCTSGEGLSTIFENLVITNGSANHGGGMYIDGSSPSLLNCTFTDNHADSNGGAIYSIGDSIISINDSTFTGNDSGNDGGGMYTNGGSSEITNCTFTSNIASNGGAINTLHASFTCTDSVFTGNEASVVTSNQSGDGGAICSKPPPTSDASFHLSGCTFESSYGSAVFIADNSSNPLIENCLFRGNVNYTTDPNTGGGALKINSTSATVRGCTFEENSCPNNGNIGSAIYVWVQTVSYQDSTFCGHAGEPLAAYDGGSFNDLGGNTIRTNCDAVQWRVEDGGNGHWYAKIATPDGITSEEHFLLAESLGGHTATISSAEEHDFIYSVNTASATALIGLRKIEGTNTVAWITGEPVTYVNWHSGEGINSWERYANLQPNFGGRWQDTDNTPKESSIVEWSADCNGDGIVDYGQILDGTFADDNGDGVPDLCDAVQWTEAEGGNGHWYQGVACPGFCTWQGARGAALQQGGDLASINSLEENEFVFGLVGGDSSLWFEYNGVYPGPWLGGFQDVDSPEYSEPDGGWRWVDGTSFDGAYQAWKNNEPSNDCNGFLGENYLNYIGVGSPAMTWNDLADECHGGVLGYVVEYSADCNGDGIVDYGQILDGTFSDDDGDGIPNPCDQTGGFDGILDVPSEYATIQNAIDAADDGDTILVGPGTYTEVSAGKDAAVIDFNGKHLIIQSSDGPDVTIIDGENTRAGVRIRDATPGLVVLEGFTIQNGYSASYAGGLSTGLSDPTIRNCVIRWNHADWWGGGVVCHGSDEVIATGTFTDCKIYENSAGFGGGAFYLWRAEVAIDENTIYRNSTGGTFSCWNGSIARLSNSIICEDSAGCTEDLGGNCFTAVCDSDGDGTFDCNDPCPNWPGTCSEDGQTLYVIAGESIQDAINGCPDGGTVSIGPGTYYGTGDSVITLPGSGITIIGSAGAASTIIDGQDARRGLAGNGCGDNGTVIEGLTITNGSAEAGGGIYIVDCSPSVINCVITQNTAMIFGTAMNGGGVFIGGSTASPSFANCTISNNTANGGGGIWAWDGYEAEFTNCLITDNTSNWTGGGVFADFGYIRFEACEIRGNTCLYGGGGLNFSYATADVINCIIDGNSVTEGSGGGTSCHRTLALYEECIFTNNTASDTGAALNFDTVPSSGAQPTMRDCVIQSNTAAAGAAVRISLDYYPKFSGNVICENTLDQVEGDFDDLGGNYISDTECLPDAGNGACCVSLYPPCDLYRTCIPNLSETECADEDGTFFLGESCEQIACGALQWRT